MIRFLFFLIGTLALILGIIGVFVPLIPTTPFILLASACYMRSSERMSHWMLNNALFGRTLSDFQSGHGIPLRTKRRALLLLWVSLAISAYFMPLAWLRPLLLIPGVGVSIYLWRYKTRPLDESERKKALR